MPYYDTSRAGIARHTLYFHVSFFARIVWRGDECDMIIAPSIFYTQPFVFHIRAIVSNIVRPLHTFLIYQFIEIQFSAKSRLTAFWGKLYHVSDINMRETAAEQGGGETCH